MKTTGKKLLALALVFAFVLGMTQANITTLNVNAASNSKKVTLLKGEKMDLQLIGTSTISKVSSSNSKVIKAKKKDSKTVKITAKKKGKATVTINTTAGTTKYVFTVKKMTGKGGVDSIAVTTHSSGKYSSTISFNVKNTSGVFLNSGEFTYELLDATGSLVERGTFTLTDLYPNKSIHKIVDYSYKDAPIAAARITKFKGKRSSTNYKYTDLSKKISVKLKSEDSSSKTFKIKNKTKKDVTADVEVLFYDANDNLIYVRTIYVYLKSKGVQTESVNYIPDGAVRYKINTRAYTKTYIG